MNKGERQPPWRKLGDAAMLMMVAAEASLLIEMNYGDFRGSGEGIWGGRRSRRNTELSTCAVSETAENHPLLHRVKWWDCRDVVI